MWDKASSKTPVGSIGLAPNPPQEVLDLHVPFERLSDQHADVLGEIADVKEATERERQIDREAARHAIDAGEPFELHTAEIEARAAAKIAGLHEKRVLLADALDEAGNRLARGIEQSASEWATQFPTVRTAAVERLHDALAIVRQSILEISQADGAMAWLADFDAVRAAGGDVHSCVGRPLKLDIGGLSKNDNPMLALKVLDVFGQIG